MGSSRQRSHEKAPEGRLVEPSSVDHGVVRHGRRLLDEAELGTEEASVALEEAAEAARAAEQQEAAIEAAAVIAPPPKMTGDDTIDPEELEARLEQAAEPAELLSLHAEDPLAEALLDEGGSLEEEEADEDFDESILVDDEELAASRPSFARQRRPRALSQLEQESARQLLEAERVRLLALAEGFEEEGLRAHSEREDLGSLSAVDQHPADVGTETFDRERDLSIREQVEGELKDVTNALERLADGSYGLCEACGEPIDPDRLEAEPATRFCLADQRELEREVAFKHREVEL